MRYRLAFALTFILALTVLAACSSAPPPKARNVSDTAGPPPMSEALRPQLTTASLAATPTGGTASVAATGDTLRLTRYWTPSKGSGTSMIVTGGLNSGSVTAKPDTVAYGAGQATLILPGAR